MKNSYYRTTIILLVLCTHTAIRINAQSWQNEGIAGFSAGLAGSPSLALSSSGIPYVAYIDNVNGNKATVMKYNGSSWVVVGSPGFTATNISFPSIAIDASGTPYVGYADAFSTGGQKANVMKYDGSNWVQVGSVGFSAGPINSLSLKLNSSGIPYVAYGDDANSGKATVMMYNGSNWVNVGSVGFSDGDAFSTSLAIDNSDMPYIAYEADNAHAYKATVMKYNGSSWIVVGGSGISPGLAGVGLSSIAIDGSGTPYVAYTDIDTITSADSAQATVMKYNGSSWVNVGSPHFSVSGAVFPSIAINSGGEPYVTYGDYANGGKVTAMKYNGSSWVNVGIPGFSAGAIVVSGSLHGPAVIAIDGSGNPYVSFSDSSTGYKATVMKYGTSTLVPEQNTTVHDLMISLFPDPATSEVTIAFNALNAAPTSLCITSISGQVILTKDLGTIPSGTLTLPTGELPAGMYMVQLTSGSQVVKRKLVKE